MVRRSRLNDIIWHKEVPLKVSLFVQRLLRYRIPAKNNLFRWDILHQDTHLCMFRCGLVESAEHLFLVYPYFDSIWHLLRQWLDILGVDPLCVFITFFSSVGEWEFKISLICFTFDLVFVCLDDLKTKEEYDF